MSNDPENDNLNYEDIEEIPDINENLLSLIEKLISVIVSLCLLSTVFDLIIELK